MCERKRERKRENEADWIRDHTKSFPKAETRFELCIHCPLQTIPESYYLRANMSKSLQKMNYMTKNRAQADEGKQKEHTRKSPGRSMSPYDIRSPGPWLRTAHWANGQVRSLLSTWEAAGATPVTLAPHTIPMSLDPVTERTELDRTGWLSWRLRGINA